MRAHTAPERAAISSAHFNHYYKFELENPNGAYQDMSSFGGYDWLNTGSLEETLDGQSMMLNAVLHREIGGTLLSLAPERQDSTLNRDNAAAYAPFLDVGRRWRLSVAVMQHGVAPVYKALGEGLIDKVIVHDPEPMITLPGRCLGASLLDAWISDEVTYSGAMETVIQNMLNDHLTSPPTLYTPVSPSFVVNPTTFSQIRLGEAIASVARLAAFVVRYRYDASDVFRLTLYKPNRTASVEDWTLGPTEYTALPTSEIDINGVRNKIIARYFDSATGQVETHVEEDPVSIARYGGPHGIERVLEMDLAEDTNITTAARVNTLTEAILSDLKIPGVLEEYSTPGFWIAQMGDYGKFLANSVHSDQDRFAAVTNIRHAFANGLLRTTLGVRGKPSGGYRSWISRALPPQELDAPTALIKKVARFRRFETVQLSGAVGGVGLREWRYTYHTDPPTTWSTVPLPVNVTLLVGTHQPRELVLEVRQPDGQIATATHTVVPLHEGQLGHTGFRTDEDWRRGGLGGLHTPRGRIHTDPSYNRAGTIPLIDSDLERVTDDLRASDGQRKIESRHGSHRKSTAHAGHAAQGISEEGRVRAGSGGLATTRGRILTETFYSSDGADALIDPVLKRAQSVLKGPAGTHGMDVIERGGGKGDTAIDSGGVAVAVAIDFSRSYTNKHLGNVPDDATSDRRAATANEKTGGSRAFNVITANHRIEDTRKIGAVIVGGPSAQQSGLTITGECLQQSAYLADLIISAHTLKVPTADGGYTSVSYPSAVLSHDAADGYNDGLWYIYRDDPALDGSGTYERTQDRTVLSEKAGRYYVGKIDMPNNVGSNGGTGGNSENKV